VLEGMTMDGGGYDKVFVSGFFLLSGFFSFVAAAALFC
jgi:hypothetical protein